MSAFFDDVVVGATVDLGVHQFTRDAIIAFARAYDPQLFHLDEEAAAQGPFGRLAASGWHTAAVWMKLNVAHALRVREANYTPGETAPVPGPSPGFRNLTWAKPVYAGDTIRFAATVLAKRSISRPGWGLVQRRGTGVNQFGDAVYSFEGTVLCQRRPAPVSVPGSR